MEPRRSAEVVWATVLGDLQVQVTRANYDTWLRGTRGYSLEGQAFTISVPSAFAKEWLEKRLAPLIRKTVSKVLGLEAAVGFLVVESLPGAEQQSKTPLFLPPQNTAISPLPAPRGPLRNGQLNQKYTFSSFIVGSANRFAHAAAVGVAESPGRSYNPLFLYGGVGLGKTHLLHAIGHHCLVQRLHVLYITSEQFTNEFINALRERKTEEFRNKYRSADVLLIDDIHFIADKEQTQESFFHTFNDLHNASRQIVISSDRSPRSMPLLEDRLRSRFEWGLIADIQPPDLETRIAILRTKAEELELDVAPEVLNFIAHRFQRNVRELEGAFNRVVAYARLMASAITNDLAANALADILHNPKDSYPTPDQIIAVIASHYHISQEDLLSPRRTKEIAYARQVAMYLMRKETPLSLAEIGLHLGGRDHSTVVHGYEKIALESDANSTLRRTLLELSSLVRTE